MQKTLLTAISLFNLKNQVMQKNESGVHVKNARRIIKCLLMMKLIILLVCALSMQSFASGWAQVNISLNLEKVQMKKVFKTIENQSNVRFVYNDDVLPRERRISIRVQDATLEEVMRRILVNTNLGYKLIDDDLVVISPLKDSSDPVAATFVPVNGKVTNGKGEPLSAVTVLEKGTNNGTSTRDDGRFSLNVTGSDAILVFSYIGYRPQEVRLGGQTALSITLTAENSNLNEVVVIGYQTVRRKDLTGATGLVNMEDANKLTTASVGEAIQGLVPGVTVRNPGNPGANATVEIRGVGSFTNSAPLYVIDGMLADANSTINTDDVASIQILKDASASAIYGSRAGNGVIIITTKKGKEGPSKFSFSAKYGIQQIPKKWDVMGASQYLKTVQTEYNNSGIALPAGVAAQVANNTINTNWQDAVTRTGNDQDYNMTISGGSRTSSYLLSGSYYKNQGVLIGNDFQRSSLRINTETHHGLLTVGENVLISNTDGSYPGGGVNAFYEFPSMLPIVGIQGSQYNTIPSNPAGWGMGTNDVPTYASNYVAVAALDRIHFNFAKVVGNAYAELKFTNWLSYRFNMGAEVSFDYTKEERDTGIWRYNNQPPATGVNEDRETFTNFLLEHTLNFNKSFGAHVISAVVGFSRTQQEREFTSGGRTNLQTSNGQTFSTIGSATGTASAGGGTSVFWREHGYLGRINYAYNDRYLVTLTGRIDQDTRFGPQSRTGYFPSVAAAWRISKEHFFNVPWISDLKLRGSYGRLGISSSLDSYGSWPYLAVLNNSPRAIYGSAQSPMLGQYQAVLTDPDIHWETRVEKNIGFDATLFDNRISVTADLYNALSQDVLVALPAALYLGVTAGTVANVASIRNKGIELSVTYRSPQQPFKWEVSGNLTTIDNKVIAVGNQGVDAAGNKVDYIELTNFTRTQVGHSIGQWDVIKTDGIFQSQQEINAYTNKSGTIIQPNAKPGDVKYIDANGDGTIDDKDRQYAGSPWPTLQAGAQFNASYKHFTFGLQLIGVFGNKLYDDVRRVLDSYQLTNFRSGLDPWSASNPGGKDPRLAVDVPGDPTVATNNFAETSRWLENGSYVRIRNIEIGYSLPGRTFGNTGITNTRIYISGQNLLTLTAYKGLDPDVVGNGILERGFDNGNWPPSRVLSAGIQFDF
jgi:TonB-linked SusC/RagA family outer membrane protein